MTFKYSDAWLLEAIKFSENEQGATLTDIIQTGDYINHAIMTYEEFTTGTKKLKSIGLLTEQDKRLRTTEKFEEWWAKKYDGESRIIILKALEEIQKYLDQTYGTVDIQAIQITTEFTESDFDWAIKDYLKVISRY